MKKLLFVVNVDWFFLSHRLPIALAAMENGYEVHLACSVTGKQNEITKLGIILHQLPLSRNSKSIVAELRTFFSIYRLISQIKPDVIHMVTIKPVIYAGMISRFLKVPSRVASISGLGYVFIASGFKAKLLKIITMVMYRVALNKENTKVIFQNESDKSFFVKSKIIDENFAILIPGSGVFLNDYKVVPEPTGTPVVMLVARLLIDKGVREFVEASRLLKSQDIDIKMVLVGDLDENPKSIAIQELNSWKHEGVIEHWGYSHDIANTISQSNIMVLPSYREGLPKSLIEAAACGRAVITTDVPGCKDAIIPDVTGLLVPVKDSTSLANAIVKLIADNQLRYKYATNGRKLAEEKFDINSVISTHLSLYSGTKVG